MLPRTYEKQGDCSLARALEVVGERWTLLIVRDALFGVRRFSDFYGHLDAPRTVLSGRLRTLVEAGVLERKPDPDHAGRHLYELTEAGQGLWPAVHALGMWGQSLDPDAPGSRRVFSHHTCGERLDPARRCPACDVTPGLRDVTVSTIGGPGSRTDPVALALRGPHRMLDPLPPPAPAAA